MTNAERKVLTKEEISDLRVRLDPGPYSSSYLIPLRDSHEELRRLLGVANTALTTIAKMDHLYPEGMRSCCVMQQTAWVAIAEIKQALGEG